jgi:DNA repair protein RadC
MPSMRDLEHEEVCVVSLDTRSRVLKVQTVYRGSVNTSVIRVAELFRPAIELQAAAILVAHNHPSNDPTPSPEDVNVTREICKAGNLLDVDVLDHIVLGNGKWVSLRERGLGFDTNSFGKRKEQNNVNTIH